ncbi:MAG TPA: right-handed parallel beta-helix repeat-containing protein [Rudaea sp.]|nr:right-handed parallel beta-helix repeat-containing protein [Rudaea sp.]
MKRRSVAMLKAWSGLLVWLVLALPASASTVCVPADMSLAAALNQAQTAATTIHLIQGTHDLANTVWHRGTATGVGTVIRSGSELIGGYTAACASRDIAAGNTTLIDSVPSGSDAAGTQVNGDLTIEGITFKLQNGLILASEQNGPGGTLLLLRDAFLDTTGNTVEVAWRVDGAIRIVDSLYANNSDFSCLLDVRVFGGSPDVDFINNTVVNNSVAAGTNSAACFGNYGLSSSASFRLYNNIFYGTAGSGATDLYVQGTPSKLVDNQIGSDTFANGAPGSQTGTHTGNPQLNASYKPIQAPVSPVINAGSDNPPGGLPVSDLDGGPRLVGTRVDRGAYESSLDFTLTRSVTKTADDGTAGTLRNAIADVNTNGEGKITFNIGTGCANPHVITLDHTKPDLTLTVDSLVDGYTQPGAVANGIDPGDNATICVILETDGSDTRGLVVPASVTDGTNVTIQGLGFSGFTTAAIDLQGGSQHIVSGNHFGGSIGGHALAANGFDIRLGAGTHDDTVGTDDIADRNIIGGASGSGIVIAAGATNNQIVNNYIGIGWGGAYTAIGNGARGIYVAGDTNTISGNLIGNNAQAGIVIDSLGGHDNLVLGNFIGADAVGTDLGNTGAGIHLIGDSGGTGDAPNNNTIRSNTIAQNGAQGVLIDVGQGNRVRKNSIYGNANLGIDLDPVGPNSPQSSDGGLHGPDEANRGQNFPVLTAAQGGNENGTVAGSLTTTGGDFTIDFYNSPGCDSSGFGEGKSWLGGVLVTVTVPMGLSQGTYSFTSLSISASLFQTLANGSKITATATDTNGNTSEFSACVNYLNDTLFTDGFDGPPPQG